MTMVLTERGTFVLFGRSLSSVRKLEGLHFKVGNDPNKMISE